MKIAIILTALFFTLTASAQTTQTLKKHSISNSGCSIYNYCHPKYDVDFSNDSSKIYTGECISDGVTYGVVCVKLLNTVTDLQVAEDLMIAYVDFLKGNFNIVKAAGYGRGHILNKNENTRGILDYWEDAEKDKWKIKAWTDGRYIGFVYAYGKKDLPESKVNVFLDSFRLPEK